MAEFSREYFALTQQLLASWLGVSRTSLALSETGRRNFPLGSGMQDARLIVAAQGLVLAADGTTSPAPSPLPVPTPHPAPLTARLNDCRYRIISQGRALDKMRKHAIPYKARLAALPALRAWTGPVRNPAHEENWLALFEAEAVDELANHCGAGPQRLLEARIAGLEREAELLEEMLAGLPPAP